MKKSSILLSFLIISLFTLLSSCSQNDYELVWSDEFDYTGLPDSTKWSYEVGASGWGNNELQYYTERRLENARVENGTLIIEAIKENYEGSDYTSARLSTYGNKHWWQYGKMEASIKLPYGQGIWPAFWMLSKNIKEGTRWPACGEIDIMEQIGGGEMRDDMAYGTVHWADANNKHVKNGDSIQLAEGIFNDAFHTFTIEWTPKQISWLLDGKQYHTFDISAEELSEFHFSYYIILNLAVGGNWPGYPDETTVLPQKMVVDYVRVYQMRK